MIKYIKMNQSFSIFQDNKDVGDVPYIKHHLTWSLPLLAIINCTNIVTAMQKCLSSATEDLNHGAADGRHFFYFPHSVMIKVYPKA